jgi:hypothetical protein
VNRRKTDDPMKKPSVGETDKLRALTEDPELRALMEQFYAVPAAGREPIVKAFNEKADALHPDRREAVERSKLDGGMLRAMFIHTLKETLARPNLTEFEQLKVKDVEAEFITLFDTFLAAPPAVREGAFRLALAVQDMALAARLEPGEEDRLRRQALIDMARKGGTTAKKEKPWVAYAMMLALKIPEMDRTLSNSKIADKLWDWWALEKPAEWVGKKPARPSHDTLADFIGKLRPNGTFPPRPARARCRRN